MRKILLATTALIGVAFAGAAHAAAPASPISLNVGGYDDFVAGYDNGGYASGGTNRAVHDDFENEFKISFDALGKASNGIEYGANVALWNGAEVTNNWIGQGNGINVNSAYVWMSGAFGKVLFGDEHGASDLFVYAPTVGEGQIDGRFENFISDSRIASFAIMPSGFDNTEHSTKVTYYTPKIGNDMNKVQAGISYAPSLYNYGADVIGNSNTAGSGFTFPSATANNISPYQDLIKAAAQYTGNFKPFNVTASGQFIHGGSSNVYAGNTLLDRGINYVAGQGGEVHDFNAWGLGAQVGFEGFTFGGAYNNLGDYNTVNHQNGDQNSFNVGGKYEFDKVGLGVSYIHGQGYDNLLTGANVTTFNSSTNYVSRYNAVGAGATYTWFPGLTSNVDGVAYGQHVADEPGSEGGYTVLLSQRLAF